MDPDQKEIEDMLNFDPLHVAEQLTGSSYKDDEGTSALGFGLHIQYHKKKKDMLAQKKDSYMSMNIKDYINIIESIGFKMILRVPFSSKFGENDIFFIFWREDGILLHFDTYCGKTVNGGSFHYNWIPNSVKDYYHYTSSGGFFESEGDVYKWSGDHDCREAVKHKISLLEQNGKFINPWEKIPFMYLLHHGDNDKNHKSPENWYEISANRCLMFPKKVQLAMFNGEDIVEHFNEYNRSK